MTWVRPEESSCHAVCHWPLNFGLSCTARHCSVGQHVCHIPVDRKTILAFAARRNDTHRMANSATKIRLYVEESLSTGTELCLDRGQAHYLTRVMRQVIGDWVLLFNGQDGEWLSRIINVNKNECYLAVESMTRPQTEEPQVCLVFAPIKKARLDFMVEKATELGASRLQPIVTKHTDVSRINTDRLAATVREAAEQCERLSVPTINFPSSFEEFLDGWDTIQPLMYMDETGYGKPMHATADGLAGGFIEVGLLVGPEGGFATSELDQLRNLPFSMPVTLGPRVLRAETAALTALSIWQSLHGDGCEARIR